MSAARGIAAAKAASSNPADAPRAPAISSWTSSIVAINRWLKASATGDQFIYAHGHNLLDPALAEHVRKLAAEGEVKMRTRRAADGVFDYFVIRDRVRIVAVHPRKAQGPVLDEATNGLLLKLKAVARAGERCPSDKALAAAIGLERNQVSWCFRKLRDLELISTEIVATPSDPKFRIVTIVASGDRTALPTRAPK